MFQKLLSEPVIGYVAYVIFGQFNVRPIVTKSDGKRSLLVTQHVM
jgi:hypothetical protein